MKAISLWQPWASAIALGNKCVETRSWSTSHRGPLLIHAAKRWTRPQREFAEVERSLGRMAEAIPFGAIVACATLSDVRRSEELALEVSAIEKLYGDYRDGRYGWVLTEILPFPEPIPFRGAQGLFDVPYGVVQEAIKVAYPP